MTDVYSNILAASSEVTTSLIDILEMRASDPLQVLMRKEYLKHLSLTPGACVVEVGCGTGAVCRSLNECCDRLEIWGIDPCLAFLEAARDLAHDAANVHFSVGDVRRMGFANSSFDALVAHTVLSHVPDPELALAEAHRVLKRGGRLAVFDGDYVSTTVSTGLNDPLEACVHAALDELVFDKYLVRKLHGLVARAGFTILSFRTHPYLDCWNDGYLATFAHRGAKILEQQGRITSAMRDALQDEVRDRLRSGRAFGHILYGSVIAVKP